MVNTPPSSGHPLEEQPVTSQTFWGYGYIENQVHVGNINYQPNPTRIPYARTPYPSNTFTP